MAKKVNKQKKRGRKRQQEEFVYIDDRIRKTIGRKEIGKVYIKERGKKGRYYKQKDDSEEEDYINAYYGGLRNRKKGVTKGLTPKDYMRKVRRRKGIDSLMRKGVASTTFRDVTNFNQEKITHAYKQLLANSDRAGKGNFLVNNPTLLDILSKYENVQKYKNRLSFKVVVVSASGTELAIAEAPLGKGKDLNQVCGEVNEVVKIGQEVIVGETDNFDNLRKKGYNVLKKTSGFIGNIWVKMTFRKGRG